MTTVGDNRSTRVGGGLSFTSGSLQAERATSSNRIKESLQNEENAAEISVESPSLGKASQAIDVAGALATATEAISSIQAVRKEQLELAQQAEETASQELRDEINNAIADLEDEVGRIASSATYNGNSVLTNGISTTFSGENGQSESIVTASASSVVSDLGLDVTSVADASAAVETLQSTLIAISDYRSGLDAASSKTDRVIQRLAEPQVEAAAKRADRIASIEEAEQLAAQVASDIRSSAARASPELTQEQLVSAVTASLDPSRVSGLLG